MICGHACFEFQAIDVLSIYPDQGPTVIQRFEKPVEYGRLTVLHLSCQANGEPGKQGSQILLLHEERSTVRLHGSRNLAHSP